MQSRLKSCPAVGVSELYSSYYGAQELFVGCVLLRTVTVVTVMIPFSRFPVFPVAVVSEWKAESACSLPAWEFR